MQNIMMDDVYITGTGQLLYVHSKENCKMEFCVIHNPSNHSMKDFPTHWRSDRYLMERICSHGVGHPDPDDLAYKCLIRGDEYTKYEAVHGCDN